MFKSPIQVAIQVAMAACGLLLVMLGPGRAAVYSQTTMEWMSLAPAGEGFAVSLPAKPDEQTDRTAMMGNTYKMRLYTSIDEPTGMLYMVIMQEFPSMAEVLTPRVRLDRFMEGFKDGLGKSLSEAVGGKFDMKPGRDLDLKGHAGRQYDLAFGETRGVVRTFDASRRIYVLIVMGAGEGNANVITFFNSFEIKPAPDPVPQPVTETKP